jgi:Zn-dependent protease
VVGPISNFVVAAGAVALLAGISLTSPAGHQVVHGLVQGRLGNVGSPLTPVALLFYQAMFINVILGVFNLIPVPPLDGSHVVRHFLPETLRNIYDAVGTLGLILLVWFGGKFLWALIAPFIAFCNALLLRF